MVVGMKRRKPVQKGLAPGERLKRDKLSGAENEYSQWGWINRTLDSSSISMEHMLTVYGFLDKLRKPICKNKYLKSKEVINTAQMPVKPSTKDPRVTDKLKNEEDIIILSSDDETQTCDKKACKDNPHCLNYLGQARLENEEASLKAYLQASELESSPLEDARDVDVPVGLKVWFQDLAFRDGVYRCITSQEDDHSLEESPIFQLQVTFAALQEGTQRVFNPIKLVESLKLRTFEQQDAQEFSKLFMNHLATEFEKQAVPSLKTLISDQVGQQSYGTMCKKCKHKSEHDSNFLELEVGLEANGNRLEECIEVLLQSEELTDDNKYYCANCDSLQDAIRYTKLRRLPPVLHFSVLRFVFDVSTLERKKSKHAIVFPRLLDMSPFMEAQKSEPVQVPSKREHPDTTLTDDHLYELRGVLLHKGASAYHGHYEAQVFDVTKKQFYQFNDEVVTPISSLQLHKPTADEKLPNNRRTYARKKRRIVDSDIEAESSSVKDDLTNYTSSKDAYMLIYARCDKGSTFAGISPRPQSLTHRSVEELNCRHEEACNAYLKKKEELVDKFELMRSQKQKIYRSWCIEDVKEDSAVVSRRALEAWLSQGLEKPKKTESTDKESQETNVTEAPAGSVMEEEKDRSESPIDPMDLINERPCNTPKSATDFVLDNTSIQCPHGALDPLKVHEMKRMRLNSPLRILPEKRYTIDHTNHITTFDELNESADDFRGTWISKTWLRDWRQPKPKMHSPGKENPHPESFDYVEHVRCPHGQLSQSSTLRIWINESSLFPDWKPTLTSSDEMPDCPSCEVSAAISKENRHEMKLRVDREKDTFRMLLASTFMGMEPQPTPGVRQALIGADFFRRWRAWISRPYDKPRPESIDNSWLLCEHGKLVVDPSKDLGTSVLLITLKDWENFLGLLTDFDFATISIRLYPDGVEKDSKLLNGNSQKEPVSLKEKDTSVKRSQPLRVSHRLRDSNRKVKIKDITVRKDMTVKEMKMEIQDVFNIPTICQQLFLRGNELTDGSETVASLGILANETLDLKEEKEVIDMDSDVDIDSQRSPKKRREEGRAFGGTVLSGDVKRTLPATAAKPETNDTDNKVDDVKPSSPETTDEKHCPMCTFINPPDVIRCTICESDLV
ncbi:hypothetical protein Clacol_006912 [Clathrus columnatus]|uniref:ubiquitinyl hydrolase 1 n=1 Tax=Clathrus columnatus TaxID=1419009 RepID=A0AAV5AHR8_9AGAM|nr:hypothetical protein Clacol_006912 [Clathrus columnatus]